MLLLYFCVFVLFTVELLHAQNESLCPLCPLLPESNTFTPPVLILVFMLMTPQCTSHLDFSLMLQTHNQQPIQQLYLAYKHIKVKIF